MSSPFICSIEMKYQTPNGVVTDIWGLNILTISDTWDASLIKQDFINVDGSVVDNLGFHARQIRFTTYWFGTQETFPSYYDSPTYENHLKFVNAATNSTGIITFTHPKYGTVKAKIESISVRHDDTQNYAEIEIGLIEDSIKTNSRVIMEQDIQLVSQKLQIDAINGEIDKLNANLESLGIADSKLIDVLLKITAQVTKASNTARKWMKEAEDVVSKCEAFATAIEQPLNVVTSALSYGTDIPTRILGSVQRVTDRIGAAVSAVNSSPAAVVSAYSTSLNKLIDSVTGTYADMFKQQLRVIGAASAGVLVATAYATDTRNRDAQSKMAMIPSFDVNGRRIGTIPLAVLMTVSEIERSLYSARALIQAALNVERNNAALKTLAMELVTHVDQLKLKSLDIRTMTVTAMPIHMLCLQIGLPYNQAERILRINSEITNPSFIKGNIEVYVRT